MEGHEVRFERLELTVVRRKLRVVLGRVETPGALGIVVVFRPGAHEMGIWKGNREEQSSVAATREETLRKRLPHSQ